MLKLRIILIAICGFFLVSTSLFAAFPGQNGKIVFERAGGGISIMNADGTGETVLISGHPGPHCFWCTAGDYHDPKWSADGTKIIFHTNDFGYALTMNADGSNVYFAL